MKNYYGKEYEGITMDVDKVRALVSQKISDTNDIESVTEEIVEHLTIDLWDEENGVKTRSWNEESIVEGVFSAIEEYGWSIDDFLQNEDDTIIFRQM
jgi:uncharacterized protein YpuA (DUF1002 family)